MRFLIVTVGKKHDDLFKSAIEEYSKRVKNYFPIDWKIIPTSNVKDETTKILATISLGDFCFLLDDTGINCSSEKLADLINERLLSSDKRLVFIIGGAYGFDQKVIDRANFIWSLGKLTFPHQLVRLVVSEQLYRALTIIKGEKYHHSG